MKELEKIVDSNGEPLEIVDSEARADISEIKQSLSQLDGLIIYKDLTPTDDYAEFDDGSNLPLISLISTIEPIQSGSGTPSPTNPRPISGHTDIDIIVSPNSDFSGGTTYTVNFVDGGNPLIVYGGTIDVASGLLTVNRVGVDMGNLYWNYLSDAKIFTASVPNIKSGVYTDTNLLSSIYPVKPISYSLFDYGMRYNTATSIGVKNPSYTDAISFKTAMSGAQLVYEPATPQTYQLTPTEVNTLLGRNYINSDIGIITNVKYLGILNIS